MSKGYTINFFLNTVQNANGKDLNQDVTLAIAPRAGSLSVKFDALDTFLGGNTYSIAYGWNGFGAAGKTARVRLTRALKARKNGTLDQFVAKYRG